MVGIAAADTTVSNLWTPIEDTSDWSLGFPWVTPTENSGEAVDVFPWGASGEDRSDWISGFPGVTPDLTRDRFILDSNGNWLPNGPRTEIPTKPTQSINWDPANAPDWTRGYSGSSPSYPFPFFRVR